MSPTSRPEVNKIAKNVRRGSGLSPSQTHVGQRSKIKAAVSIAITIAIESTDIIMLALQDQPSHVALWQAA